MRFVCYFLLILWLCPVKDIYFALYNTVAKGKHMDVSAGELTKKASHANCVSRLFNWCRKRGSNPHGVATTGF